MTAAAPTTADVASTTADVASTTPAVTTTTSAASTTSAVTTATATVLGDSGRRNGHCRCQHTHRQEEAPTLDAHDCLRNPAAKPSPSAHCEPINTET
jgi:hypothetical protein